MKVYLTCVSFKQKLAYSQRECFILTKTYTVPILKWL